MSAFERNYLQLVHDVCMFGTERPSRVGPTLQVFGAVLRISALRTEHFPLLTTRKMHTRGVFGELAAFLKGATLLKQFKAEGCNYWDDNAFKWSANEHRTQDDYKVGRVYGAQWRNWEGDDDFQGLDQIAVLVAGIKADPMGRRHLITAYNPAELHLGCLPPCHLMAQFNVDKVFLDCMVTMRSVDLCLGLPSDIVLYAALLVLVARAAGYRPGTLIFSMGDAHVYSNHIEPFEAQLQRETFKLPTYNLQPLSTIDNFSADDLEIIGYQHNMAIKFPLNT